MSAQATLMRLGELLGGPTAFTAFTDDELTEIEQLTGRLFAAPVPLLVRTLINQLRKARRGAS